MRAYLRFFLLAYLGGLVLSAPASAAVGFKPDMPVARLWADRSNQRYTDKIKVITCRTFRQKPAATIGINWTDDCLVISTAHKHLWCGEVFLRTPIQNDPARSVMSIATDTCPSVRQVFAAMSPEQVYRPLVKLAFTA